MVLFLGILFSTTGFTLYYFLNKSAYLKNVLNLENEGSVRAVIFRRLSGITIFLILPLLLYLILTGKNLMSAYTGSMSDRTLFWLLPLGAFLILINYFNSRTPENINQYPEIREKEWTPSLIFLSALSWIVYLFAYEFLFRAMLFIPSLELFGFLPAVVLNTGIYSLVHIHKGVKEGIGSIFLGFVLCLLVAGTGTFWIAFFVHVILALSSEWFSLKAHPEMKVIRK
jgi:hypothetical protein